MDPLVSIRDLKVHFYTERGIVRAVDGISLDIERGATFGLAGESGSGKSTTSLAIMRLLRRPGRIAGGEILFNGKNLLEKSGDEMRTIRGSKIAMVFQDPTASLNPVLTIEDQMCEVIELHQGVKGAEKREKIAEILTEVRIPNVRRVMSSYPHELSTGMRQRVMIGMALSCCPEFLIADEPTSSLDVTIEAQVICLLKELIEKFGTSLLLITHNLGVIAEICDTTAIMYAGKIVELSDTMTLFTNSRHPYTHALLASFPRLDIDVRRLEVIDGLVPNLIDPPPGCRFRPRCRYATEVCGKKEPEPTEIEKEHLVACWNVDKLEW